MSGGKKTTQNVRAVNFSFNWGLVRDRSSFSDGFWGTPARGRVNIYMIFSPCLALESNTHLGKKLLLVTSHVSQLIFLMLINVWKMQNLGPVKFFLRYKFYLGVIYTQQIYPALSELLSGCACTVIAVANDLIFVEPNGGPLFLFTGCRWGTIIFLLSYGFGWESL